MITLDEGTLREFYSVGSKYVYYIDQLRLDDPTYNPTSPCAAGVSRWRRAAGACAEPTALDSDTLVTLLAAFNASDSIDNLYNSSWAKDIDVAELMADQPDLSCTTTADGVAVVCASITVGGGECYTHTHPDNFNVYDFSYWATAHRGNAAAREAGRVNPIRRWAEAGSVGGPRPLFAWEPRARTPEFKRTPRRASR
eukprot:SAG22_NODE_14_length_33165_cov_13.196698_16_plen_197_part_00